ncbi:hypothetical protein [Coralloluteibacterium thermophilus]|uniref:Uncharacterized protein n=1 Tax=Coralloluteibacterium thermophilum TaxID=2707049 RepID=A0ABV9NNK8_9GAMM
MNEYAPDALRRLWQAQGPVTACPPDPARVRAGALRFERQIRRRNRLEYAAVAVLIPWFATVAGLALIGGTDPGSTLLGLGALLLALGVAYVGIQLHRRASVATPPLGAPCLAFHRAQLERQRAAVASVWRWYLGPLLPGLALMWLGPAIAAPERWPMHLAILALLAGGCVGVGALNTRAAQALQRQIDALDAQTGEVA